MVNKSEILNDLKQGLMSPDDLIKQFENPVPHISDVNLNNLVIDVLPSGFPTLDKHMFLKRDRGELITIGARPSTGKTAFMLDLCLNVSQKLPVYFASLEMGHEQIATRALAAVTGFSASAIMQGRIGQDKLEEARFKYLDPTKFFIDDRPRLGLDEIVATAKKMASGSKLGLIVVDYLQIIRVAGVEVNRDQQLGHITATLKSLAVDCKCPVIVGSQLNRECEKRGVGSNDYRPRLSDLRESGAIEQDSDIGVMRSRHEMYTNERKGEADVGIVKNRNGKTGWALFGFSGETSKFTDRGISE